MRPRTETIQSSYASDLLAFVALTLFVGMLVVVGSLACGA